MKRIFSLALAAVMTMSVLPVAYAADVEYTAGTQVTYTADADANREYTITVPALLNPGQSGAVTLKGKWASNETVKVTADATVELTNSINSNDKKVLNIGFNGIEKAGDNTVERTYTENVSVAAMPSDALFGIWSGKFNYNVELVDALYSYNGIIAKALPTVDGCPHAYIEMAPTEDGGTAPVAYFSNATADYDGIWMEANDKVVVYGYFEGDWTFLFEETGEGTMEVNSVWANTDVLNEDGSVYLAASKPVIV